MNSTSHPLTIEVVKEIRAACQQQVTRLEINHQMLGPSLALLRQDHGVDEMQIASRMKLSLDDIRQIECGLRTTTLAEQLHYVAACINGG